MTNYYDFIIIGAGHNGLVAAAYLAKQGKKVLVLERRPFVGGSVVTESFGEGFIVDAVQTGGTLRADIIKDLKLHLPAVKARSAFISLVGHAAPPGRYAESVTCELRTPLLFHRLRHAV